MDKRYEELIAERPDLFVNRQGGIDILTQKNDIEAVEKRFNTKIGVLYEDEYVIFIKDAVRFPDGDIAPYIRMYHKDMGGAAVLPVFKGKIMLLYHFRHSLRKWIWETPRGFSEKNMTEAENAERELSEELGVKDFTITKLGKTVPDAGIMGEEISLFFARIDDNATFNLECHEGIRKYVLLSKEEAIEKICNQEITDGITISSIMLAISKGLI